jgi:acetyltransferase-like isoleucine patch superfamily enzyme
MISNTRAVAKAIVGRVAVAKSWIAYKVYGIEGVNRLLRSAAKPEVIPILRAFGAFVGNECNLEAPLVLHNAQDRYCNFKVGTGCHIGKETFVDLVDTVTVEDWVTVSMRVTILTHIDVGRSPLGEFAFPTKHGPVILKAGAYVGAGAILLPGVCIGECAVVGAGAVVTRSVDPFTVVVGVPARTLRVINILG